MTEHEVCPFCGMSEAQLISAQRPKDQIMQHWVLCANCGARGDFFIEYVHGDSPEATIAKAWAAWDRRARRKRSEELADLIGSMRLMADSIWDVLKGSKKAGSQAARDSVKDLRESFEKILPLAKKGGDYTPIPLDRENR